ncbi:MAG: hypothetical protein HY719_10465 [Planctomycetes bacterium]|nr:hypothetical protein [Planctomycetota bacterium]
MTDPIVDEIRQARDGHARRFDFNLAAICEDLRRLQKACGHVIVSLPPRRAPRPEAS